MKVGHGWFYQQEGRIDMSVYRKKIEWMVVCLALTFFAGCGGDSSDGFVDPGPGPGPAETQSGLEGEWIGTINWETGVVWDVDLTLSRENDGTYSGNLRCATTEGEELPLIEDVSGTMNGADVSIDAVFSEPGGLDYELKFTGSLAETTISGDSALFTSDNREGHGAFTMTKYNNGEPDVPDDPVDHESVEVEVGSCLTLATGTTNPGSCTDGGDIYFWPGGLNKADLYSNEDIFCPQEGTYTSLESVPDDYSGCRWAFYVEGNGDPIDNMGYILQDVSLQHHYKMRIIKNDPGVATLEYEQID
jgi:hypothetical protein